MAFLTERLPVCLIPEQPLVTPVRNDVIHHRCGHDLALCLLIPGIVVLWVGGLAPAAPDELANGYSALLYSLPVIEAILMPVMMAVLASRLWDMEIKGNTPKLLYTLQSRRSLFAGKAVFGVSEVLLVTVLGVLGRMLPRRWRVNPAPRIAAALLEAAILQQPGIHRLESGQLV